MDWLDWLAHKPIAVTQGYGLRLLLRMGPGSVGELRFVASDMDGPRFFLLYSSVVAVILAGCWWSVQQVPTAACPLRSKRVPSILTQQMRYMMGMAPRGPCSTSSTASTLRTDAGSFRSICRESRLQWSGNYRQESSAPRRALRCALSLCTVKNQTLYRPW